MKLARIFVWLAVAPWAGAQTLEVYSEFRRVDPEGEVVAPDRVGQRREILSPAVARNAFASFRVVVSMPANVPFYLHVGQNPENSVVVKLYREISVKQGAAWIPDVLEEVEQPYRGAVAEDVKSVSFWMDLWVPDRGPARRIKVEPQLHFEDRWVIYPMEVRIKQARVPSGAYLRGAQASVGDPADTAVRPILTNYLCGSSDRRTAADGPLTIRRMIARNARQDMALAQRLEKVRGREEVRGAMLNVLGADDSKAWCAEPSFPGANGPEWYLRIRDYLFRTEDE